MLVGAWPTATDADSISRLPRTDGGSSAAFGPPLCARAAGSVPDSKCSTGLSVSSLTWSIRPSSSHFDCSPARVEIRMSSIR